MVCCFVFLVVECLQKKRGRQSFLFLFLFLFLSPRSKTKKTAFFGFSFSKQKKGEWEGTRGWILVQHDKRGDQKCVLLLLLLGDLGVRGEERSIKLHFAPNAKESPPSLSPSHYFLRKKYFVLTFVWGRNTLSLSLSSPLLSPETTPKGEKEKIEERRREGKREREEGNKIKKCVI